MANNDSVWTPSMLERTEELLESSPLFQMLGRQGMDAAMRDIKLLASAQGMALVHAADRYISDCEASHAKQEQKRKATRVKESHPEQIAFAEGAALSSKIPPLHLIPSIALEELAERFALGIKRKGNKSWNALSGNQQVLVDRDFILERISHVIHHAMKLRDVIVSGLYDELIGGDNHASAIMWGGAFLICAKHAIYTKVYNDPEEDDDDGHDHYDETEPLSVNVNPFSNLAASVGIMKPEPNPQWVAIPFYESDPQHLENPTIMKGYHVRWNHSAPDGSLLVVREYKMAEDKKEPSIAWCQFAAEKDAAEFNAKGLPPDYFVGPYQQWMDEALRNTFGLEKPGSRKSRSPIYQSADNEQWYFYDETWCNSYGPYRTGEEAQRACSQYAEHLENV